MSASRTLPRTYRKALQTAEVNSADAQDLVPARFISNLEAAKFRSHAKKAPAIGQNSVRACLPGGFAVLGTVTDFGVEQA